MTDSSEDSLRFNDCEVNLASREFRRAGELVAVEPRVFALLVYLIEHRRRAVDKNEIQDVVWKGTIVSETALTRAIMKARRAVGDSAERQSVIRTVHGHGYQFVADLATEDAPAPGDKGPGLSLATPRVFAVLIALLLITFIALLWPASAPTQPVRVAVMPVQNVSGDTEYNWTNLGLMGFANDILERSTLLEVVPAADVIRIATQKSKLDGDDERADDFERLRSGYGASHMLASRLEKNASVLRLSYSLYKPDGDIKRGTMVGAEPTELMRGMIRNVAAMLGERARPVDEITLVSDDSFVNEAYSRGLGLSLEGRCAEAVEFFEVVRSSGDTGGRAEFEWASCARILGRWQEAEAGFNSILADLPAEPSSSLRAMVFNGLGTVYLRTGRANEARKTLQLGLAEAQSAGDYLMQGTLLNSLAIDAKNRREFSEARALLGRARLAHSEADAGVLPGQVPAALANVDMAEGKLEQADEHLGEALATFRALGDRRNEAMMLNNFGYLRRLQGRYDDAEPLHLQSLAIRREISDHVGQGRILGMLSSLYLNDGRTQEAEDAAREAYRIASDANDRLFMATSLAQLANVQYRIGDAEAARQSYLESQAIFVEIEDYSRTAQVALRLAQLEIEAGNLASAEETAREVLAISLREALHEPAIEAMELAGDIALRQSDVERAISSYERAISYIDESGFISRETRIVNKLVNAHLDNGDFVATEPLIGYLIEQGDTSESLKLRARYAFVQGDVERSIELQESARQAADGDWSENDEETLVQYREAVRNNRDVTQADLPL